MFLATLAWLPSCTEDETCPVGSEGCPCTDGNACDSGLVCTNVGCYASSSGLGGDGAGGTESGGTESGGTESGGTESGGTPGTGGSGATAAVCTPPAVTDEWGSLREWCAWAIEVDYGAWREDYGTCDACVEQMQEYATTFPLAYCPALFTCYTSCVHLEGNDQNAVSDCNEASCNQATSGNNLCD